MRVIITGGSGLIGRALARRLLARGDGVVILTRDPRHVVGLPREARIATWDGTTGQGWHEQIASDTAIVNLAGESLASGRWSAERKRRIRESRLRAGQAVVDAVQLAKERPRALIQASAVGYYGPRGSEEVDERTSAGSDFLARVCVDWEQSTSPVEALGVRRAIIRTGIVLAKEGGALPRLLLPFRLFVGGRLGSGRQYVPWIHLDDEVSAIVFLLDRESSQGVFNLTGPRPVDNATFSRVVGRLMGRPSVVATPAFVLRVVLGEMATIVLDGQRAIPRRLQAAGFTFQYPDVESALSTILQPAR